MAIGLLCAGVAGNLTDRLFRPPGVLRGHVIDFLELPYWPVFNVADMCITAAAIMIMFLSVVKELPSLASATCGLGVVALGTTMIMIGARSLVAERKVAAGPGGTERRAG